MDQIKIVLYLLVIATATTLPSPWMIAAQAALGGLMIGIRLDRILNRRHPI